LLRAWSLLRRFSTWRSTVRGAMPSCWAHCFDESPRAMHSRTSRSRSDKATKSSCCRGKFKTHPLMGKPILGSVLITLIVTALQQVERACAKFAQTSPESGSNRAESSPWRPFLPAHVGGEPASFMAVLRRFSWPLGYFRLRYLTRNCG